MRTSDWRYESDERVVSTYRGKWGFPRIAQPSELSRAEKFRVVRWCVLAIAAVSAAARWLP